MKKFIIYSIVIFISIIVSYQAYAAPACFCRVSVGAREACTEMNSWVVAVPECGQGSLDTLFGTNSGVKFEVIPVLRYWTEYYSVWQWLPLSNGKQHVLDDVAEWMDALPSCPEDCFEPIDDNSTNDDDGDNICNPCDPWPDIDNTDSMFVPWIQYADGGIGFKSVDDPNLAFTLGAATGESTLLIGVNPMSLADIMSAGCDCSNPSDFAVVTPSPLEMPLTSVPTPNVSTPAVTSGGLSSGGGQSGNATSTTNISYSSTSTTNLSTSGGESGSADSSEKESYESGNFTSIEQNTAATARNTRQLVEGQNDVRDYLDSVQQNSLNVAKNTETTASNTQQLVEGQNDVRDYLDGIQQSNLNIAGNAEVIALNTEQLVEGQNDMRGYLANIQNSSAHTAANTDEIVDLLEQQLNNDENATGNAQGAADDALGEYQTGSGNATYSNYGEGDIPDVDESLLAYELAIVDAKDISGVSTAADQVGVELSGYQTSMQVSIWGVDIVYDFSTWEWFYDLVGIAFLSICYLVGFMMIVRG